MEKLENFYLQTGGNLSDVMNRLRSKETVLKFILKFKDDTCFNELKFALENNNTSDAFRAAHTLKGVCANLGYSHLYETAAEITELLRIGKDINAAKRQFTELERRYNEVLAATDCL